MDILTHTMMGGALAGPLFHVAPMTGGCFLLGSILPDLDVLSRCFGKRAFLRCHQTYTHGLPVIAATGLVAWLFMPRWLDEPWAPLALAVGMLLHVGLDLSNTYGTAVLSPLSTKRYCTEWVFFIDAFAVAVTAVVVVLQALLGYAAVSQQLRIAVAYGLVLVAYWAVRVWLRSRALSYAPGRTVSLIPSALVPWYYFGCMPDEDRVLSFRVNALTGIVDQQQEHQILDTLLEAQLVKIPEFRIMRSLSPAYHVISAVPQEDGTRLTCRDLRVRNFGGRFGELTVVIDPDGQVLGSRFNV